MTFEDNLVYLTTRQTEYKTSFGIFKKFQKFLKDGKLDEYNVSLKVDFQTGFKEGENNAVFYMEFLGKIFSFHYSFQHKEKIEKGLVSVYVRSKEFDSKVFEDEKRPAYINRYAFDQSGNLYIEGQTSYNILDESQKFLVDVLTEYFNKQSRPLWV